MSVQYFIPVVQIRYYAPKRQYVEISNIETFFAKV